ncbi:MAG: DUF885 domain-containing protein, partial [Candidatus Heimdallarchaeota archaeon]|nr:DUF885 domain-containing protein [Candidatus Heimdallarchaeota archaeon]
MSEFVEIKEEFLRAWSVFEPMSAFHQGWRELAGIVPLPTISSSKVYIQFLKDFKSKLNTLNLHQLNEDETIDYEVMLNKIDSTLFEFEDLKVLQTNPMAYVFASDIFDYLLKQYAPFSQRIKQMILHLEQLPKYYDIAISNLQYELLAPEQVEMSIIMIKGMISFLQNIKEEVQELELVQEKIEPDLYPELENATNLALEGLTLFINKLESELNNCKGSFRLGKDLFTKMLYKSERVNATLEEILQAGEQNLERNLNEFINAAKMIDQSKTPVEILDIIKEKHPTSDSLIKDTENMLEILRSFLIDSEFVTVPSTIMPKVMYTPKPIREWAFAALNSPGALEKSATDSYYYITPPNEDWPEQDQIDWLKTFNYPGLLDISAHEAFPGHYLHHLHNQRSSSLMSKLFGVYHFWEGYALYIEEAMWEHGFQKGDYHYRMAQLVETLLRNVRLICSIKLHTDPTFTVEDATQMFMNKVFLGRKPAEAE